jgi:ankyrin repeat protein
MPDGNTALHLAYMRKDIPLIEALKNAGANETIKNYEGRTPAQVESIMSHEDTVHYMASLVGHTSTVSKTHKKF